MASSEHRTAGEAVGKYHEAQLSALLVHVEEALRRFRSGELDAFEVDQELFQYSRAAKELWKFCTLNNAVDTAQWISGMPPSDWWERGSFRRRR